MKAGRLNTKERENRITKLLSFILLFKYITWAQFQKFHEVTFKISDHRRLLEYVIRNDYVAAYYEPLYKSKFYYLTPKGKNFISEIKPFGKYYKFEKKFTGIYSFPHHNLILNSYIALYRYLPIKDWVNDWVLKIGAHGRNKFPDSLMLLENGTKIALEAECELKSTESWKTVISRHEYDIVENTYVDGVLIVTDDPNVYKGLINKLFSINPHFSNKAFMIANLEMLQKGLCYYQNKNINIQEAIKLLKKQEVLK